MADEPTLPTAPAARLMQARPRLCATVAFHPDPRRVGERAVLGPLERLDAELSRTTPEFFGAGIAGKPLDEPHVSRRPLRLRAEAGVSIEAHGGSIHLDGRDVTTRAQLSIAEIERGAVLRIGWVVLVLHATSSIAHGGGSGHGMVGRSEAIERVREHVDRVAPEQVGVLVRGESGSGKELVARAIHAGSARATGPFIALNMGALSGGTAAAELFGHARGGYTGAVGEHHGAFGAADGGTLFLDEIGAADQDVQAMLLRALETGEIRRVGDRGAPRHVDVRVIAATDSDLERAVREGAFRLPLLHRLAGYDIVVPPLRARRDDLGPLLHHFIREALEARGAVALLDRADDPWLTPALVEDLVRRDYPGNVRELRNTARQIVIASAGRDHAELPEARQLENAAGPVEAAPSAPRSRRGLDDIGDDELVAALRDGDWEPTAAARSLGISKASVYQLMARSGRVRVAKDLTASEIAAARDEHGGDLRRMADALEVSQRALKRRITDLDGGTS